MTKPINPVQRQHIQSVLDNVHTHFINAVKEGRGKRLKTNDPAIFSGLFWTGEQAIQLGVADRSGNITSLMRELKLDNKVDYTIERNLTIHSRANGIRNGERFSESFAERLQTSQDAKLQ